MTEMVLRDVSDVGNMAKSRFRYRCGEAFKNFISEVEDIFGVQAEKTDEPDNSFGALKVYPFFTLVKDGKNFGYKISGYIDNDESNDEYTLIYCASTNDDIHWLESSDMEDVIGWMEDRIEGRIERDEEEVKTESRSRRGRMLKESEDESSRYKYTIYVDGVEYGYSDSFEEAKDYADDLCAEGHEVEIVDNLSGIFVRVEP